MDPQGQAWCDQGSPIQTLIMWATERETVPVSRVWWPLAGGGGMLAIMRMDAAWLWFTVTALPGMWGQQARRASRLPLILICSTVCFAFKSLAEHEALDIPWMAHKPVYILKTQDPFSKLKGIQDTVGWCLKGLRLCWIGPRVSQQHRLALMKERAP